MLTPYDWQEGIGNRAQYIESKLSQGAPVLGLSLPTGILLFSFRRNTRKLFEIYDRLGFGAIGQQADVEAIRTSAVEFASREGYQRSEEDVTIQRVVATMSQPIKRAFADFSSAPFVARCLFAEVGEEKNQDLFYVLDYSGDFQIFDDIVVVCGENEFEKSIREAVGKMDLKKKPDDLVKPLGEAWKTQFKEHFSEIDLTDLDPEALLIERSRDKVDRFRWLTPERI